VFFSGVFQSAASDQLVSQHDILKACMFFLVNVIIPEDYSTCSFGFTLDVLLQEEKMLLARQLSPCFVLFRNHLVIVVVHASTCHLACQVVDGQAIGLWEHLGRSIVR
jgi:hypothetical protein